MKNADEEKSPGHFERARFQALRRRQAHFAVRGVDAATEAQQHALGVIARDGRLDHGRRDPARTDRRAAPPTSPARSRPATRSGCPSSDAPPRIRTGGLPSAVSMRAPIWRSGVATRSIGRFISDAVADQLAVERLAGQQAGHQAHGRAGIAHVERVRRRLQAAQADAVHAHFAARRSARSARRARASPAWSRGNPRFRGSRAPR